MNISYNIAYAFLVSLKMQKNILQFEMPEWIFPQNILNLFLVHTVQTPNNDMEIRRKKDKNKKLTLQTNLRTKKHLKHVAVMNSGLLTL